MTYASGEPEPTLIGPTGWPGGPPHPAPPPPGPPPGPPKSITAAALLNLTGLGLGYAYLGRWARGALHLIVTVGLIVLAIVTRAGTKPLLWGAVAVLWLAWMALDGIRLAHRTPQPRRAVVPILVGVVAVGAMIAGYIVYGMAGHAAYTRGTDAQGRGDCEAADNAFDQFTTLFALVPSGDVAAAGDRRAECDLFTAAAADPDIAGRITAYQNFRRDHGASPLRPVVDESLAEAQLQQVDGDRPVIAQQTGQDRAAHVRTDVEALLSVQRDLGATRAAARVPGAITDVYVAALQGKNCDGLPSLDYIATLADPVTADVVAKAKSRLPGALLDCGLDQFRGADFAGATQQLSKLVSDYPNDGGVPQANSALIAAKIAQKTSDKIPVPAPLGRPGSLRVTFYNITASPMKVSVTGTSAAEVQLPGCAGCPETHLDADGCPDSAGKPSATVQVDPGLYHALLDSGQPDGGSVQAVTPVQDDFFCVYRAPV